MPSEESILLRQRTAEHGGDGGTVWSEQPQIHPIPESGGASVHRYVSQEKTHRQE